MILGLMDENVEKEDLDKLLSQFASDKGYNIKEKRSSSLRLLWCCKPRR